MDVADEDVANDEDHEQWDCMVQRRLLTVDDAQSECKFPGALAIDIAGNVVKDHGDSC